MFAGDSNPQTLGEIYAYGVRNPQRFGWDSKNGNLFVADGTAKRLLQLIREKRPNAPRVDLRFGTGPNGQVFLLNKQDNTIRQLVR